MISRLGAIALYLLGTLSGATAVAAIALCKAAGTADNREE
jgi:hypothetical protein